MKNSYLVLGEIIKDMTEIDGIISQFFNYPKIKKNKYFKEIINKNKNIISYWKD